ncbi:MAG: glucose-6-phosphate dehydrogenase [Patescibacteria group bacterium]
MLADNGLKLKIDTPTTIIIFGVTGDLSQQKLLPALFDLHRRGALPTKFCIVGFSRRTWGDEEFKQFVEQTLSRDKHRHTKKELNAFKRHLVFQGGDFGELNDFHELGDKLSLIDKKLGVRSNKLFHLAVSPSLYGIIFAGLAKSKLNLSGVEKNKYWVRLLVEKPFGQDIKTAQRLDERLAKFFNEEQIFRIDHYLTKETVQNILAFRFSNRLFEPIWNSDYIERVEINLLETRDVGNRVNFYDGIGALRDVGQSHALQMLALIAMDEPENMAADIIRDARANVMRDLVSIGKRDIQTNLVRAQYDKYQEEKNISPNSPTETYFQLKAKLNNKRWRSVPFYITAGKALDRDEVKIKIYFKAAKHCFACDIAKGQECPQNSVIFNIQPQEGIAVDFWVKKPGLEMELIKKELSFYYSEFEKARHNLPNAYEILLYNAMRGDQTNFASSKELKYSWKYITKILKNWQNAPLQIYPKGSGGPKNKLIG